MGLDTGSAIFVCAAKSYGVDFADTLMIGRQSFFPLPASLQRIFSILNVNQDAKRFVRDNGFAEEFFRLMGAQEVNSLDFSSYEGATYVQDMNSPIPDHLHSRLSVVYDGGTLEHVFNVPQALTNCMEMIRVGGHFMQVTTANNFMGHGFWQFSPELLFRVFNESNGFKIEAVLLHEVVTNGSWYLVADPDRVQERVELCNSLPTHILTIAKKVADVAIFSETPQQSDYAVAWALHSQSRVQSATKKNTLFGKLQHWQSCLPKRLSKVVPQLQSNKEWTASLLQNRHRPFDRVYYKRICEKDLLHGNLC